MLNKVARLHSNRMLTTTRARRDISPCKKYLLSRPDRKFSWFCDGVNGKGQAKDLQALWFNNWLKIGHNFLRTFKHFTKKFSDTDSRRPHPELTDCGIRLLIRTNVFQYKSELICQQFSPALIRRRQQLKNGISCVSGLVTDECVSWLRGQVPTSGLLFVSTPWKRAAG